MKNKFIYLTESKPTITVQNALIIVDLSHGLKRPHQLYVSKRKGLFYIPETKMEFNRIKLILF